MSAVMTNTKPRGVQLTLRELKAAHLALSNYTPQRGKAWKSQASACGKVQAALINCTKAKSTGARQ